MHIFIERNVLVVVIKILLCKNFCKFQIVSVAELLPLADAWFLAFAGDKYIGQERPMVMILVGALTPI
jgi:hypothetical protein